jgi:hypothetical protein
VPEEETQTIMIYIMTYSVESVGEVWTVTGDEKMWYDRDIC